MAFTLSPNMNLPIPGVGTENGPQYAIDVNNALMTIDQHNHSNGSGVQINPSGLNINTNLTFNDNFAIGVAGMTMQAQGSTPANQTVYVSGTDLYFTDGLGNNVRITQSGGVAGSPGSISNLNSPASAAYVAASSTFVWQSNTNIAANLDAGSLLMRNLSPNSTYALTLSPPAALASNYGITFPTLPGSQSILTLDASGVMATPVVYPIPTAGIASQAITVAKMDNATRQIQKQIFTSSGTFSLPAGSSTSTVYKVTCIGGGASGGVTNTTNGGGGGGAGETAIAYISGLSSSQTVTIGNGGAGVSGSGNTGNNGSNTSFGSLCVAVGGSAGGLQAGGGGGTGGTGDILIGGGDGANGTPGVQGGNGGSSTMGGGGAGSISNTTSAAGHNYGGGSGGSGGGSGASAAGAKGICIVEWVL